MFRRVTARLTRALTRFLTHAAGCGESAAAAGAGEQMTPPSCAVFSPPAPRPARRCVRPRPCVPPSNTFWLHPPPRYHAPHCHPSLSYYITRYCCYCTVVTSVYAFLYFLLRFPHYTSRPASRLPPLPLPLPLPLPSRRPRPPPRCPWLTTGFRWCRFSSVRGLRPSPRLPDPEVAPSMPPTPAAAAPCIVPAAAAAALGLKR